MRPQPPYTGIDRWMFPFELTSENGTLHVYEDPNDDGTFENDFIFDITADYGYDSRTVGPTTYYNTDIRFKDFSGLDWEDVGLDKYGLPFWRVLFNKLDNHPDTQNTYAEIFPFTIPNYQLSGTGQYVGSFFPFYFTWNPNNNPSTMNPRIFGLDASPEQTSWANFASIDGGATGPEARTPNSVWGRWFVRNNDKGQTSWAYDKTKQPKLDLYSSRRDSTQGYINNLNRRQDRNFVYRHVPAANIFKERQNDNDEVFSSEHLINSNIFRDDGIGGNDFNIQFDNFFNNVDLSERVLLFENAPERGPGLTDFPEYFSVHVINTDFSDIRNVIKEQDGTASEYYDIEFETTIIEEFKKSDYE